MPAFDFPSPSALSRSADGLWNYTFQLVDYLSFLFSCLDEENLSESLQRMVADTGWETPVLNSETGLTAAAGSPLRIRRVGACVFLSGAVTAPAGGLQDGSVPLFVLSKLYRPAYPVRTVCADEAGGIYLLTVGTDGTVEMAQTAGAAEEREISVSLVYCLENQPNGPRHTD